MRIFITGATGYIGTAVTSALINAGHEVTALVRPRTDGDALERAGVTVLRGELGQLVDFTDVIAGHDAAVHAAADRTSGAKADAATLDALLAVDGLRIIYTSGVWVFGNTGDQLVDESSEVSPIELVAWRPSHEKRVLSEAAGRAAVIRPGCVYGAGQSLLAGWFAAAESGDPLELIGDGVNRWAMVYLDDLADLYLKAIEENATGILHGVDDTRATLGQMARAIIETADSTSEIRPKPVADAREEIGPFADALALDQHVSSDLTREMLQWEPSVSFLHSVERQWEEWNQSK